MRILYKKGGGCSGRTDSFSGLDDLSPQKTNFNTSSGTVSLLYGDVVLSYLKTNSIHVNDQYSSQAKTPLGMSIMGDHLADGCVHDSERHGNGTSQREALATTTHASTNKENVSPEFVQTPMTNVSSSFLQDLLNRHHESPVRSSVLHDFTNNCDDGGTSSPALAFMERSFPETSATARREQDSSRESDIIVTIHSDTGTRLPKTDGLLPDTRTAEMNRPYSGSTLCRYDQHSDTVTRQQKPSSTGWDRCSSQSKVSFSDIGRDSRCAISVQNQDTEAINPDPPDIDNQSTKALLGMNSMPSQASCTAMTCIPTHGMTLPLHNETKGAPRCYVVVPLFRKKLTNRQLIQLAAMMALGFVFVVVILIWVLSPMLF